MDQLAAMKDTFELIESRVPQHAERPPNPACDLSHFRRMYYQMAGINQGGEWRHPSDAKLGRWLGWMQGAACARGLLTLDEAKEINKRWAD